ncbi:hypothetical protein AURDEDRAFT_174023 [Auricularia subglabra TFB-10046 SS5]|uniref:F-box domain-containing protein n=1 Tax=Auricularia subglabra (strain TFB-10046 / SS5) TaxID=717982 RepID=J0WV63_AURST|nr:hypothetical protein AURDEDRAFT_174023 [Auricularia subglabra TFB-10046 SS5]
MVPDASAEPASITNSTSQPRGLSPNLPLQQPAGINGHPSPVHSLPQEIFGEVFMQLHLLPAVVLDAHRPNFAHAMAVFTVASVCRLWRAAALGRPGLWSRRIAFDFTKLHKSGPRNEHWLLYLRTYLLRARARPLCLHAVGLAFHSDWEGSAGQDAWRQILDALPRCVRFSLRVYPTDGTGDLLPLSFNIATPFLEEFALIALTPSDAGSRYSTRRDNATFLPSAPRLRKLFIQYPVPRYITWTPFPALEELYFEACLTEPRRADLLDILPACEHISKLEIHQIDTQQIDAARYLHERSNSTFTLPNLRTLVDDSPHFVIVGQFAPLLARGCPDLQTLRLKTYTGISAEVRAIETVGANLTTLRIEFSMDPFGRPHGILPQLLGAHPVLEDLTYTDVQFRAEDFEPLSAPDPITGLWIAPRLHIIKCSVSHPPILEWVQTIWQLVRFVKMRTESSGQPGSSPRRLRVFELTDPQWQRLDYRMPEWVLAVVARLLHRVPRDDV